MDLRELSSALPKPWLNINAHTVNADSVTSASFAADDLVIQEQAGVANPAGGKLAIYSDLTGKLKTNDQFGNVSHVVAQAVVGIPGNIPVYDATGYNVEDSLLAPIAFAQLNGASFTGDISAPHMVSSSVPVQSWLGAKANSWGALGPGSVAETALIDPNHTGSLTLVQPVVRGFTLDMSFISLYASGAATTMTLRFKVNGTTVLTSTIPVAAPVLNKVYKLDYKLLVNENDSKSIYVTSTLIRTGDTPIITAALDGAAWNTAGNNLLAVTGQFNDVDGTWLTYQWDMRSSCPQNF